MKAILALAALLVSVAPVARAQSALPGEPPVTRGVIAVRLINNSDCRMAWRISVDGVPDTPRPLDAHQSLSLHFDPDSTVRVLEVVASPRLCVRAGQRDADADRSAVRATPRS